MLFTMRGTYVDRDPKMARPVQNINHSALRSMFEREKLSGNNFNGWFHQLKLVLRVKKKMFVIEHPIPPAPAADSEANMLAKWNVLYDVHNEVACLMLGSMTHDLHRQFKNYSLYEMLQGLRSMFEKQDGVERFDLIQTFHACKQEEGKSVAAYVLQMKGYVDQLQRLGYGFREARKLKQGALYLYVENGVRAQVEAIGSFDLVFPNSLVICLDNCHSAPSITRVMFRVNFGDVVGEDVVRNVNCDDGFRLDMDLFKWIFKKKTDVDDIVHTYKARLVAKGYTQLYEVDYEVTFSPVADIRAIRILISIAAFYNYEIWQMDVKTAFLNGYLDEDIYMVQPESFVDPNHTRKVCKLQRSIYDLKQASKSWNKRFDKEIKRFGFDQNLDEPCVYQKASGSNVTFLILYVDDIIIMGNHIPSLQSVKDYLGKCFARKDLEEATFILGIKIYRDRSKRLIGLGQNAYMDKILKRYKMDNSKCGHVPMQERLDLNRTQGASTPKEVKHMQNVPYASAVGSIIGAVDWKNSKQTTAAMSATEAECIAASEAVMEAVWIRKFI
nr:retrotransposon protein, putative, Ty1-copia subclass [Tanacetum cinerariifolium]